MTTFAWALGGAVAAALCLGVWLAFRSARKQGAAEERGEQFETTADILEAQRDAMADRPDSSDPDDVLDRL